MAGKNRNDYFKKYHAERKEGIKHGPVKNTSLFESTGSRGQKVMYDPYNFAKVAEKVKADQQKAKEQAKLDKKNTKNKAKEQKTNQKEALKIKDNQRRLNIQKSKLANIKARGAGAGTDGPIVEIQDPMLLREKQNLRLANKYRRMNMGGVMKNRGGTFKGVY